MERFTELVKPLAERSWAVMDDFLSPEALGALVADIRQRWQRGELHSAGVGRGTARVERTDIRGDSELWLDPEKPASAQIPYVEAMHELRQALNRTLYLSLVGLEAHYAVYPPGTFYRKHRDRFADNDERMLSSVLYLNPDW